MVYRALWHKGPHSGEQFPECPGPRPIRYRCSTWAAGYVPGHRSERFRIDDVNDRVSASLPEPARVSYSFCFQVVNEEMKVILEVCTRDVVVGPDKAEITEPGFSEANPMPGLPAVGVEALVLRQLDT